MQIVVSVLSVFIFTVLNIYTYVVNKGHINLASISFGVHVK